LGYTHYSNFLSIVTIWIGSGAIAALIVNAHLGQATLDLPLLAKLLFVTIGAILVIFPSRSPFCGIRPRPLLRSFRENREGTGRCSSQSSSSARTSAKKINSRVSGKERRLDSPVFVIYGVRRKNQSQNRQISTSNGRGPKAATLSSESLEPAKLILCSRFSARICSPSLTGLGDRPHHFDHALRMSGLRAVTE
jgi:hypothetical protein